MDLKVMFMDVKLTFTKFALIFNAYLSAAYVFF